MHQLHMHYSLPACITKNPNIPLLTCGQQHHPVAGRRRRQAQPGRGAPCHTAHGLP